MLLQQIPLHMRSLLCMQLLVIIAIMESWAISHLL